VLGNRQSTSVSAEEEAGKGTGGAAIPLDTRPSEQVAAEPRAVSAAAIGDEPAPRYGVLESVRAYRLLAAIPVFLLVGVAAAIGILRTPTYTSEARLQVQLSASTPAALPGAATASAAYAETYARAIEARQVIVQASKKTGIPPDQVISRVSATQVPSTSVLTVSAEGDSERQTIALAEATSTALQDYTQTVKPTSSRSRQFLVDFKAATLRYQEQVREKQAAEQAFNEQPTAANRRAVDAATAEAQAAELRRNAIQSAYANSNQPFTAPLRMISPADSASSDRVPRLQLLLFLGLVAGLMAGAALATARANAYV
jgi:capsular polysaccharide biosynthesis protein